MLIFVGLPLMSVLVQFFLIFILLNCILFFQNISPGWTALHAQELGFRTIFVEDCSRGIDPNDIKDTLDKVRNGHGVVINSNEVSFQTDNEL